jgi:hypothetical protein
LYIILVDLNSKFNSLSNKQVEIDLNYKYESF